MTKLSPAPALLSATSLDSDPESDSDSDPDSDPDLVRKLSIYSQPRIADPAENHQKKRKSHPEQTDCEMAKSKSNGAESSLLVHFLNLLFYFILDRII